MKKLKILFLLALTPFLVSCTKFISNPDVQTLNQKATELMNSGDTKGAIARLESINDLNPDFAETHYNLGIAYYKDGEYEKSIESMKTAIELKDDQFSGTYYTIGLAYQDLAGKETEKLEALKDPKNKKAELLHEILAKIIEDLNNSKNYYIQYINIITNSEEKERISQEVENIDRDIQKYKNWDFN